ncbi:MAG: hypothetical protein LBR70_05650 [Lactobacillaceae bacterium]|jgi:hypothetical protein|nr:hypothetical protein [Lactobacillaceae bacterium]
MALQFANGQVVLNPSEGSPAYDVLRPFTEGIISEISDVPLATETVDMCQAGWVKHITRDASLRIKATDNKNLSEGDLFAESSYKGYILGSTYTVKASAGYKFECLRPKEVVISNSHLFAERKKKGGDIDVQVEFILNDTVLGTQVVFTVL